MAKISKKILLLIFGLLLSFILLEVLARVFLPPPRYVMVKNANEKVEDDSTERDTVFSEEAMPILFLRTKTGFRLRKNMNVLLANELVSKNNISIKTNSLGLRSAELPAKKDRDYRILVLGDSITFADQVNSPQIYTSILEEYLNKKMRGKNISKNIQVINAGIGGTGSQTQLTLLTELFPIVKPDMVIFQLYLNDAHPSFMMEVAKKPEVVKKSRLLSKLYALYVDYLAQAEYKTFTDKKDINLAREKFYDNDLSEGNWEESKSGLNRLIYEYMGDWGFAWDIDYAKTTKNIYSLIKEISDNHNTELEVFMFPVSYQVQAEYLEDTPQRNTKKVMDELGIKFYDLLPDLRAKYKKDEVNIFFDHCHLRPEGHKFVGDLIGEKILSSIK